MLVSEQASVFQVRGLRCSKEPTVLGLSPVRLGNRTYRAWMTPKLTRMVRRKTESTGPGVNYLIYFFNFMRKIFQSPMSVATGRSLLSKFQY